MSAVPIGIIIGFLLLFTPHILILINKNATRKNKTKWFLISIAGLIIGMGMAATILLGAKNKEGADQIKLFMALGPVNILTMAWGVIVWLIFRSKHKTTAITQ